MKKVKTRFAPSPTGYLHIGSVRTALYAYLYAKKHNGNFILRIEDTDQNRIVDDATLKVVKTLEFLNLKNDEGLYFDNNELKSHGENGPYVQSERLDLYKEYINKLIESGHAYYCFCSIERLDSLRELQKANNVIPKYDGHCRNLSKAEIASKIEAGEPYVIRLKLPENYNYTWNDAIRGNITINSNDIDDKVLIKSDGFPTYHFAVVVDDHLMEITHVLRGEEWTPSTPIQLALYEAFGWEAPVFAHLPTINGYDGKKLSKRQGDVNVEDYLDNGYLKEALLNYVSLVGWTPESTKEIFSLEELINEFSLDRVSNSGGIFDVNKLKWVNAHYIKNLDIDTLKEITVPHLEKAYDLSNKSDEWVTHLISIYKDHISYGAEIADVTDLFFKDHIEISGDALEIMNDESIPNTLTVFKTHIENISEWNIDNIKNAINNTKDKSGAKGKLLFMPIRIKVTGQMHGPELPDTIYLLGKETVLNRLSI